jgi:hypothetical protein
VQIPKHWQGVVENIHGQFRCPYDFQLLSLITAVGTGFAKLLA